MSYPRYFDGDGNAYENTGEVRLPQAGEYGLDEASGRAFKADRDFAYFRVPILKPVKIEEPHVKLTINLAEVL